MLITHRSFFNAAVFLTQIVLKNALMETRLLTEASLRYLNVLSRKQKKISSVLLRLEMIINIHDH